MRLALPRALTLAVLLATPALAATGDLPPATAVSSARLLRSGGTLDPARACAATFEGALDYEGHLARPRATTPYRSRRVITVAGPMRARQDWTTWQEGDSTRTTESTLLLDGRVLQRADEKSPWVELAGRAAADAAWPIWASTPSLLAARGVASGALTGGPVTDSRSRYQWPDPSGKVTVELDMIDEPFQVAVVFNESRRGALTPDCRYFGTTHAAGLTWPDSVATSADPVGAAWRMGEKRTAIDEHADLAVLAMPADVRPAAAPRADTAAVTAVIAPHVWSITLPDAETRSLLVEFADHCVLLETSSDVPHGERLRAAALGLSRKPVRYVSFSHHHPDYTGGLRPFLSDSAIVVCAASNRAYVSEIGHQYFGLDPDRLAQRFPGGVTPRFDTLTTGGRWRHADAVNELVAIDIGAKSNHTDAYLVFWLPRAKLLFEGDLGWFERDGELRASSRAAGLLQAVDAAKLAPATVLQGWTPGATPASVPAKRLRELAAARAGK